MDCWIATYPDIYALFCGSHKNPAYGAALTGSGQEVSYGRCVLPHQLPSRAHFPGNTDEIRSGRREPHPQSAESLSRELPVQFPGHPTERRHR